MIPISPKQNKANKAKSGKPVAPPVSVRAKASATLLQAIARENYRAVRAALAAGAEVNTRTREGQTPLILAIGGSGGAAPDFNEEEWRKAVEKVAQPNRISPIVMALLTAGASVNVADGRGWTPLVYAVSEGNEALAKELLRRKANINYTNKQGVSPLGMAVARQNIALVDLLLRSGANPRPPVRFMGLPLLTMAVMVSHVRSQRSESDDMGSLMTGLMGSLLGSDGGVAAMEAVVERLLRANVDPNELGKGGITPLVTAVGYGTPRVVRLLIERGAKVDALLPGGMTALFVAAHEGRADTARVLLEAGANPKLVDAEGNTPLTIASTKASYALVERLLALGVDPRIRTKEGKTARDLALEQKHTAIVRLLDSHSQTTAGKGK